MKKILLLLAVAFFVTTANAQVRKPFKKSQNVAAKQKVAKVEIKEKMKAIALRRKAQLKKEGQ